LSPGDTVLLVTDGFEEAISPQNAVFGVQRILDVVRSHTHDTAVEIVDALFRAVSDFSQGQPQVDDLTLVVIKVRPPV
jgi:sigma-B regulation protein RsbU (phosphoserine phosphatase)